MQRNAKHASRHSAQNPAHLTNDARTYFDSSLHFNEMICIDRVAVSLAGQIVARQPHWIGTLDSVNELNMVCWWRCTAAAQPLRSHAC